GRLGGELRQRVVLFPGERRRLTGGPAGDEPGDAAVYLEARQLLERGDVDFAGVSEGGDEGGEDAPRNERKSHDGETYSMRPRTVRDYPSARFSPVQEEVNDDAGDRNVQPDGQEEAGDTLMDLEAPLRCEIKR